MSKEESAANNTNMLAVYSANVAKFGYGPYFACKTIAEFPVTDPANMDAWNMQAIARHAIKDAIEPPAIANKAAEEGELPALPDADSRSSSVDFFLPETVRTYARQAIAADRASRQVANKAEVEPVHKDVEWLAECADMARSNPQLATDIRAKCKVATPPATAGASTALAAFALRSRVADLLHLLEFAEISTPSKGDAEQAKKAMRDVRRMLNEDPFGSKPVAASTVLTDERTAFEEWVKPDFPRLEGADTKRVGWYYFDAETNLAWDGWKARAEVAAQAGQVAVQDVKGSLDLSRITSVVLQDRGSKSVIVRFGQSMAAATKFLDQFGTLVLSQRAAQLDGGQEGSAT